MPAVVQQEIFDVWIDFNATFAIDVGTSVQLQNQGEYAIRYQEGVSQPSDDDEGVLIGDSNSFTSTPTILDGSERVWVRCTSPQGSILSAQVVV